MRQCSFNICSLFSNHGLVIVLIKGKVLLAPGFMDEAYELDLYVLAKK